LRMRLGHGQSHTVVPQACHGISRYYWNGQQPYDAPVCERIEYRDVYRGYRRCLLRRRKRS
jgi:hypothetical protein